MNTLEILFWAFAFIVFYSFFGYGIVLFLMVKIRKSFFKRRNHQNENYEPTVSFIVPCYNEASIIKDKILNTLAIDYPKNKLQVIFITDGSTDGTDQEVSKFDDVELLHLPQRKGKSAAENRSVAYASGEVIIFSDANTELNSNVIRKIVRHYTDPMVGAVSGEKKIFQDKSENAAGAGEGFYWKYESKLKKWDSELLTVVGAAGELISFRKHLFTHLEEDTILDDFILSLRITERGYRVQYEPEATATETASANSKEELKRKVRICAGGWQAMSRLTSLFNFTKHPILTFQYVSHRVLRWTLAPVLLLALLPINVILSVDSKFYQILLVAQIAIYIAAAFGYVFENKSIRIKPLFIPYYFLFMNYAAIAGFFRFAGKKQSSTWERSERKVSMS
jgi:cellulose synthase/poly-beta-1,6-N-acetylglucosamine synthase-like glycosyltransferase